MIVTMPPQAMTAYTIFFSTAGLILRGGEKDMQAQQALGNAQKEHPRFVFAAQDRLSHCIILFSLFQEKSGKMKNWILRPSRSFAADSGLMAHTARGDDRIHYA